MRKILAVGLVVLGGVGIVLQLVPVDAGYNPPVNPQHRLEARANVPPGAQAVLNKACRNCHSNETDWPWYARIAPASWLVARDVAKARKAMNLSEWAVQNGRTRGRAIGTLTAACAGLQAGRMPPAPYRLVHPEARLSAGEVQNFCEWAGAEARELQARK